MGASTERVQSTFVPRESCERWLPEGKIAAVSFSVDDIHPSTSKDPYEAGGDLEPGGLRRLARLLQKIPQLRATLFVTPDWRPLSLQPTRILRGRIHYLALRSDPARVRPYAAIVGD